MLIFAQELGLPVGCVVLVDLGLVDPGVDPDGEARAGVSSGMPRTNASQALSQVRSVSSQDAVYVQVDVGVAATYGSMAQRARGPTSVPWSR